MTGVQIFPSKDVSVARSPLETASSWNYSNGKRIFDLAVASCMLIATFPLLLIVAVIVKCTSHGPVIFRQTRVGKDNRLFQILKFRTMTFDPSGSGVKLTRGGDKRITGAGRWLRRLKVDELPQVFNVLRGDMSVIGPRPDVPQFYAELRGEQRQVLSLKPGITGWATLHFRNEEEILREVPPEDLVQAYVTSVLTEKVRLDLEYAHTASFATDLRLLIRTIYAVFA